MYYLGRVVGAFFNQFFKWLFWNKTGQKILFTIVIAIILFVFIKCGEVAAVEPDNFSSYDQISWDGTIDGGRITNTGYFDYLANNVVYYVELNPYNYYVVTSNTSNRQLRYGFSNSLNFNQQLSNFSYIDMNGSGADFSFSGDNGFKYLLCMVTATNTIIPDIYYNPYPFEVTPMRSSLISYAYGLYEPTYFDSSSSYRNQCTWFYPIKKGFSYRILNGGNQLNPSTQYSFSFLSSVVGFNTYYNAKPSNTYNSNYDSSVDVLSIVNTGGDFVAPDDGYIILPGYLNQLSSYSLFCSQSDVAITAGNSSVNNNLNNVNSSINNVNDSLTDSSISSDVSDYTLPDSGVTDIAESGFANIFDKLRTAFTSSSSGQELVVNVPFTDKSFIISKSTVFGSADLGLVGTLINSFWYFIVSLWIAKDIAHKINRIKSGNIEFAQTNNIKEDLL